MRSHHSSRMDETDPVGGAEIFQVTLKDPEYREIQRVARSRHMSLAEWVRQALDSASRQEPTGSIGKKVEVIRRAAEHDYPAGDIDHMLAEIESGYGSDARS